MTADVSGSTPTPREIIRMALWQAVAIGADDTQSLAVSSANVEALAQKLDELVAASPSRPAPSPEHTDEDILGPEDGGPGRKSWPIQDRIARQDRELGEQIGETYRRGGL
jgi:hypothetical protein